MYHWLASVWVYWVVSLGLGAMGLAALLFGWFGDRWRYGVKTPRCRKCRYDMSGTVGREGDAARTCPECGKVHKSERLMHRPRRGWIRVASSGLLLFLSTYLLTSQRVATCMRVYGEPWYMAAIPDDVRLWTWSAWPTEVRMKWTKRWLMVEVGHVHTDLSHAQLTALARNLEVDIRDPNSKHRNQSIWCLRRMAKMPHRVEEAVPVLAIGLSDPDPENFHAALELFERAEIAADYTDDLVNAFRTQQDKGVRWHLAECLSKLIRVRPAFEPTLRELIALERDPDVKDGLMGK